MSETQLHRLLRLIVALILVALIWYMTPVGRYVVNLYGYRVQKTDDSSSYKTRKTVEDSCRAMISSYTSDWLTYEQYKDSESEEKRSWAEMARMRANKTAASYNEYILKNSYVWDGNVPDDIKAELPYI